MASPLAGAKRLAVLAYLVVGQPDGFHRRDTLLGLFWPDLHPRAARNALSNMLHHLRRALGKDLLRSRRNADVGLADGVLWCDAVAFEEALRAGRTAEGLALYRGDLLEGFSAPGTAVEFEHWLDAERVRLRRLASQAAYALTAEAEEASRLTPLSTPAGSERQW
jgi:DNA-binding SARP family transcriptional activator